MREWVEAPNLHLDERDGGQRIDATDTASLERHTPSDDAGEEHLSS